MALTLPPPRRLLVFAAALAVALAIATYAVTRDRDGGTPRPDRALAEASYQRVLPGLCEAAERAASRDVAGAQTVFMDLAHQGLHILAADVTASDRAVATTLLEAMAKVETDIDQASAPRLLQDLPPLLDATRAAFARLGRSVPDPCR